MEVVPVGFIFAYGLLWIPLKVVFNPLIGAHLAPINSHSIRSHNLILYLVEKVCLKTPEILLPYLFQ